MRALKTSIAVAATAGLFIHSASAANLLAYYEFEGNYNGTVGPAAAPSQNPGELSFTGGFRGQGVDVNDPNGPAGNTGGSIDIPIDANPPSLAGVTFGGWVNVETNVFDGFMAMDNGGWDRGITVSNNAGAAGFGIASGAAPVMVGSITPGSWQFVVGTFNQPGATNLYVGDANPGIQTTLSGTGVDATFSPFGLPVIEIGRYDNQDLDGVVDDLFVFGEELNAYEVNALRNLRLSGLDYSPALSNDLFNLFDASSSGDVGGLLWSPTSGLDATNPGEVFALGGGQYAVVLDGAGNGLLGVPEPAASMLVGLTGVALLFRRRRK